MYENIEYALRIEIELCTLATKQQLNARCNKHQFKQSTQIEILRIISNVSENHFVDF